MQKGRIMGLVIAGVILAGLIIGYACTAPKLKKYIEYYHQNELVWTASEDSLYNMVNKLRETNGKTPLPKDDLAYVLAHDRCGQLINEFALTENISHNTEHLTVSIQDNDGSYGRENIAASYYSVVTCYKAWEESEDHYKNMLGDFDYTGVGVLKDDTGRKFYCQVFVKK